MIACPNACFHLIACACVRKNIAVLLGGSYKVCWCAVNAAACKTDALFNIPVGTFAANGPTAVHTNIVLQGIAMITLTVQFLGV